MPATTFLLLVATVLSVDGSVARIDRGHLAGLQASDAGSFYYLLTVGSYTRRIEVGTGTVIETGKRHALVEIAADAAVIPGHFIELRIAIPAEAGEELLRRARGARSSGERASPAVFVHPEGGASGDLSAADLSVRDFVLAWAEAWSDQRIDDYIACYARNFRPPGGISRGDWESLRRRRISSPASITVSLEQLKIVTVASKVAVATFIQSYQSDAYQDRISKLLDLVREDGEWRILEERVD